MKRMDGLSFLTKLMGHYYTAASLGLAKTSCGIVYTNE